MTSHTTGKTAVSLLGLGAMGTALADAWLTAGHPLTVWNRTAAKAEPLVARGAGAAATPAEAVAAGDLVVLCLLNEDSLDETLAGLDLAGRGLVNLTTSTPGEARARAAWAAERGARFLDGGIMAVPPMIGVPESGAYVLYSGDRALFDAHRDALAAPAGTVWAGDDPGHAALTDVALLTAMSGMFAGATQALALVRRDGIDPAGFAGRLGSWLTAMAGWIERSGGVLEDEDSNLAMQVAGNAVLLRTAEEQRVSSELLAPYYALMSRALETGRPLDELLLTEG
ncbi:dehydrogenase [Streptomyces solincola]|uniref:Dehydrogenase n=1 Tax=Streptomyces solincola TaxID=2100817 RepID=A0A2S9PYH2_9ACTN|nr:NAD(P)-binding domain-containing protein [Streptomyces solincola]PRH79470.1 dehydrogenase [Streptomyces solincola]